MVIRLMTLATVLMLLACLMIGATLALAGASHARAAEVQTSPSAQDQQSATPVQADPVATPVPYQPNLADNDIDQYNFDGLALHPGEDGDDDASSASQTVSC